MKKNPLLLVLMSLIVFSSCKKEDIDGVYNPKDKISRIYNEDYSGNKYLFESWNWDKNQLKSIEQYNPDGNMYNTETYSYDGKGRITTVHSTNYGGQYSKYFYEDDRLDYIESYFDELEVQNHVGETDTILYNVLVARFDFSYNAEDKFSEIISTEFVLWDYSTTECSFNPFRFILPEHSYKSMQRVMKYNAEHSPSRGDIFRTTTMTFEWEGDNISKWTSDFYYGSDTDVTYVESYQYDDKTNPYNNLYDSWAASVYKKFSNENNLTRCSIKLIEGGSELPHGEQTYTYEYEKDLPVKRVCSGTTEGFPFGVGVLTFGTYYYEYK